jgi:GGDEF domain-containing protein
MPVRFANDADDPRQLLEEYMCVEEIPRKSPTSTESSSAEPPPTVLVAKLTGVPHNQMAEDVGRRLLAQSCWAFQERKRKEAAQQPLPIVGKVTLLLLLPPYYLTGNRLLSIVGKRFETFLEKGSVVLRIGSGEHALTIPNFPHAASLTQPFVTLEDATSAITTGYLKKEYSVEVFAHHRESVRNRVRDQLTLMEIPLSEDVAQKLAKDDWLAQCLAEASMNEERAAENVFDGVIERINITDVVRSLRERVLAVLTESGYLSAPPATLQTWLSLLANDDSVAAVLRRHGMNALLAKAYLVEEAIGLS